MKVSRSAVFFFGVLYPSVFGTLGYRLISRARCPFRFRETPLRRTGGDFRAGRFPARFDFGHGRSRGRAHFGGAERGGGREIKLTLTATGEHGCTYQAEWDQADWANARVTLADGTDVWLADLPLGPLPQRLKERLPIRFDGSDHAAASAIGVVAQVIAVDTDNSAEAGCGRRQSNYDFPGRWQCHV